jgi:hypothetical protein
VIQKLEGAKSYEEIVHVLSVDLRAAEYMLNKKSFLFRVEVLADPEEGFLIWQANPERCAKWQVFYKNLPEHIYMPYRDLPELRKIELAKHLPVLLNEVYNQLISLDSKT